MLPPPGSVGNVLAKMGSRQHTAFKGTRRDEFKGDPIAAARALHAGLDKPTDETPIPPTSTLVTMFEQPRPVVQTGTALVPPSKSPRAIKLAPDSDQGELLVRQRTKTPPPVKPKPKPKALSESARSNDGVVENINFKNIRKDTFGAPPLAQNTPQKAAPKPADVRSGSSLKERTQPHAKVCCLDGAEYSHSFCHVPTPACRTATNSM